MASFSREIIQQVLAANDIVDVISAYVDLKPSGTDRFVGLSPFQNERTPSFHVTRSKQAYYCFSTDQGGDLITFLQKVEGLTFVEAVERLAERGGVTLPAAAGYDKREDYERKQIAELGAFALKYHRELLADPLRGGAGRRYLDTRQFSPEVVQKFAVGFAAEDSQAFVDAARAAKYNDRILELSGLAKRGQRGGLYSFFRNRLMFPIRDTSGRVVAFGGRDITGEAPGKYINSPENLVYKKGRTLYGLYEGREAMRREKRALLVEGYFDVMRCHEAGVECAVATCGTALTADQARLIRRYAEEAILLYDGDAAGIRAATRGVAILMGAGLGVRIVTLPNGADPDDYIQEAGVEAFREQLEQARDFVSYYAEVNAERMQSIEGRNEIAKEMFAVLQEMNDPLRQDSYLQHIAKVLRLPEHSVRVAYERVVRRPVRRPVQDEAEGAERPKVLATFRSFGVSPDDAAFVTALLTHDAVRKMVEAALEDTWAPSGTPFDEVVAAIIDAGDGPVAQSGLSERARALYAAAATDEPLEERQAMDSARMRINRLKRDSLDAESRRLDEAIRQANEAQDMARVIELVRRRTELKTQMEAVGAL